MLWTYAIALACQVGLDQDPPSVIVSRVVGFTAQFVQLEPGESERVIFTSSLPLRDSAPRKGSYPNELFEANLRIAYNKQLGRISVARTRQIAYSGVFPTEFNLQLITLDEEGKRIDTSSVWTSTATSSFFGITPSGFAALCEVFPGRYRISSAGASVWKERHELPADLARLIQIPSHDPALRFLTREMGRAPTLRPELNHSRGWSSLWRPGWGNRDGLARTDESQGTLVYQPTSLHAFWMGRTQSVKLQTPIDYAVIGPYPWVLIRYSSSTVMMHFRRFQVLPVDPFVETEFALVNAMTQAVTPLGPGVDAIFQ